jgi:hypothetical protein
VSYPEAGRLSNTGENGRPITSAFRALSDLAPPRPVETERWGRFAVTPDAEPRSPLLNFLCASPDGKTMPTEALRCTVLSSRRCFEDLFMGI